MGELQKHIDLFLDIGKNVSYEEYLGRMVIRAFILESVEEMRQDFPFEVELTADEKRLQEYNELYDEKLRNARDAWFKKWLAPDAK